MKDIAPELLEKIKKDFEKKLKKSETIKAFREKVKKKTATYKDANDFAIETGELLADAFQSNLSKEILPDGKMYYNIADRVIRERLEHNYDITAEAAVEVQKILNEKAGIGIKAIKPEMNEDRVRGIINIVSGGKYCEWCNRLTGVYNYEAVSDTGNDVFRRHKHCRCTVEYDAGDGKVTNVHTKKTTDKKDVNRRIENTKEWSNKQKSDKIKETPKEKEKRIKEENGLDLASRISGHPKMLSAYTPRGLYYALKESGYEIKPLKGKNYRDIPFEEGGGYRVNFGGDGLLMYHPGERSHHGGEYYKISTGEGGVKRYDINGKEKED